MRTKFETSHNRKIFPCRKQIRFFASISWQDTSVKHLKARLLHESEVWIYRNFKLSTHLSGNSEARRSAESLHTRGGNSHGGNRERGELHLYWFGEWDNRIPNSQDCDCSCCKAHRQTNLRFVVANQWTKTYCSLDWRLSHAYVHTSTCTSGRQPQIEDTDHSKMMMLPPVEKGARVSHTYARKNHKTLSNSLSASDSSSVSSLCLMWMEMNGAITSTATNF